jgi:hypothetical protein
MHTSIELAKRFHKQYEWMEAIRRLPLEPNDYCRKWVPVFYGKQPGERGYKAACIKELARVTGVAPENIERNWGKELENTPSYLPRMLRMADIINQAVKAISLPPDSIEK